MGKYNFTTRRLFIAGTTTLAMVGTRRDVVAQGAPFTRRSVRGMSSTDPDLAAMQRAVAAMKALPQSDPRNWIRFADIHRNFCPHGNWYFLPWHRAYILSFERICRELSGKADFALPYWNWTADRQFPAAFAAGDRNSNPLNHTRPGIANMRLTDDMVGPQVISRIFSSPDYEAFGSARPRGQDSSSSQWQRRAGAKTELEFNPHDGVHQAIGGNMSVVDLSARDPIFFLHHANIDRLWTTWNRRGNANSTEAMWRDLTFNRNFINPDGSPWNVGVGNLGSPAALGYRYDDENDPFAAEAVLASCDLVTERLRAYRQMEALGMLGTGGGVRRIDVRNNGTVYVATTENETVASRDRPIGISIPLGRPLGDIVNPVTLSTRPDSQDARQNRRYVWAIFHDVEPPLDATTRVRVFCNCRGLTARTGPDDQSYATSISFFGRDHGSHGGTMSESGPGSNSLCVDLTSTLARVESPLGLRNNRLMVQLLPQCSNAEVNASNVRPRRVDVVII